MRARAATLLIGTILLTAGCGDDDAAGAAGDLVQGRLGELDGSQHSVLVPTGELTVTVTDGQDTLSPREAADAQERDAPAGTQWVGLDWTFSPGGDVDPLQRTLMRDPAARTTIALETGGTTVDLGDAPGATDTPAATRTSGVVYVAVDTDAAPVLEVGFDGETARLDTGTGQAEGGLVDLLDGLAAPATADCPPLRAQRGSADVTCSYVVTQVPYLAGRGWSDDGWTVAQVETRIDTFELGGSTYAVRDVTDSSTVEGAEPSASTVVDQRLDSLVSRVVAEGPATGLALVRRLSGVRTEGDGPDDATLVVSGSVALD